MPWLLILIVFLDSRLYFAQYFADSFHTIHWKSLPNANPRESTSLCRNYENLRWEIPSAAELTAHETPVELGFFWSLLLILWPPWPCERFLSSDEDSLTIRLSDLRNNSSAVGNALGSYAVIHGGSEIGTVLVGLNVIQPTYHICTDLYIPAYIIGHNQPNHINLIAFVNMNDCKRRYGQNLLPTWQCRLYPIYPC